MFVNDESRSNFTTNVNFVNIVSLIFSRTLLNVNVIIFLMKSIVFGHGFSNSRCFRPLLKLVLIKENICFFFFLRQRSGEIIFFLFSSDLKAKKRDDDGSGVDVECRTESTSQKHSAALD